MEEKITTVNNLKISYKIAGSGPVILILHGWGGLSDSWKEVGENLAERKYKVVIPDLPGFGKSDFPSRGWSINDYLRLILGFAEELGIEKFFLLGHSFGGRMAVKFASQYPEKLQGLILCDAAGITKRKTFNFKVGLFLLLSKFGKFLTSAPFLNRAQPHLRRILYFFAGRRDYFLAQGTMKETFKKVIKEDLRPYLEGIKVSTLIIWGEKDRLTPVEDAYFIKKKIKNSELIVLPEIGHSPHLEAPEKLTTLVAQFLE